MGWDIENHLDKSEISEAISSMFPPPPLSLCALVFCVASAAYAMFSCSRYFPSLPVRNFPVSWERRTGEAYELLVEDRIEERDLELADVMETEESE